MRRWGFALAATALAAGLAVLRTVSPERPMDTTGPRALVDSVFALGLLLLVLVVTGGVGRIVLRVFNVTGLTALERVVFGSALGLGTLAVGISLFAFTGMVTRSSMLLLLGVLAALASVDCRDLPADITETWGGLRAWWRGRAAGEKLGLLLALALLAFALQMALVPAWDYDGLMYHLQAPKLLLEDKRLTLQPDLWQANGPLSIEMLYALGLSVGSDVFAKLVHLWFGVLLVLGTAALGGRVLGHERAWLSGLLILGVPTLPFWASAAYTDVAWAAFETLCILGLVLWLEEKAPERLALAGLCLGLALGTKSLALMLVPIAGLAIVIEQRRTPRSWLRNLITFFMPAALVGGSWYLRNLLLAGNPLYPLVWGGPEWPAERVGLLSAYLQSFGLGRRPLDYALLPLRIFVRPVYFGTFARSLEFPSFLFLLAPAYLPAWRSRLPRFLGVIAVLRFALWAVGSQQTRFLLPIFPCAAVLSAGALHQLSLRWSASRWRRTVPTALILTWLLGVLAVAITVPGMLRFQDVLVGRESKAGFLRRVGTDFRSVEFIHAQVPSGERVLLMWDGRGFYCDRRCVPDAEQSRWTWYVQQGGDVEGTAALLRADGISYLLHSYHDALFILDHDPTGANRAAQEFFLHEFRRPCTRLLSSNPATEVYEITCTGEG